MISTIWCMCAHTNPFAAAITRMAFGLAQVSQCPKLSLAHRWPVGKIDGPGQWLINPIYTRARYLFEQTNQKGPPSTVDGHNPAPLRNHGKLLFVVICGGIIIPGILRWCRILSIHSMAGPFHCHPPAFQGTAEGAMELRQGGWLASKACNKLPGVKAPRWRRVNRFRLKMGAAPKGPKIIFDPVTDHFIYSRSEPGTRAA